MDIDSIPGSEGGFGDSPESLGSESQDIQESSESPPAREQPTAQQEPIWEDDQGEAPGYAQVPGTDYAPPQPPWQQPSYAPPQQGMEQVDWRLLNGDYQQAIVQGIHARYDGLYRSAQTAHDQHAIQRAYAADVREVQVRAREAQVAQQSWIIQQQQAQQQRQLLPMVRQAAAETLARKHGLKVEEVLKDRHGRDIWDASVMELLAQETSYRKYGDRVRQRKASGADAGYSPSGSGGGDDVSNMTEAQWNAFKSRVRRTGGRALYDTG
jgi:hypothetical protein